MSESLWKSEVVEEAQPEAAGGRAEHGACEGAGRRNQAP